jgi:16S rRNA (cytidine1402-2'-O)-methyltransferase
MPTQVRKAMAPPKVKVTRQHRERETQDSGVSHLSAEHSGLVPKAQPIDSTAAGKGILYVVATPIGNLADITVRALETLKEVDIIACEDPRTSRVLLDRWNVATKLMSLHKFSEARKTATILERLRLGDNVALISDAGTPAISDPGSRLVRAVLEGHFRVIPIPGASSITAALSASGMEGSSFVYLGFAPKRATHRNDFFEKIAAEERTSVFFDTPMRILASLEIATTVLGDRRVVLMRELTKIHEEILTGTAADILATLHARETVKGEIVVLVEGISHEPAAVDLAEAVGELIEEGLSGKRLADEAHKRIGVRKSVAYEKFLEMTEEREPAEED